MSNTILTNVITVTYVNDLNDKYHRVYINSRLKALLNCDKYDIHTDRKTVQISRGTAFKMFEGVGFIVIRTNRLEPVKGRIRVPYKITNNGIIFTWPSRI